MDGVPIANDGENQQQKRDQQKSGGLRGVNRVAAMLGVGVILALSIQHDLIVRRESTARTVGATLRVVGRGPSSYGGFSGNPSGPIVRFGLFELDLAVGELRKNGAKVRRQEQPFRILVLLLERAGELVTGRRYARNFGPPTASWISTTAWTPP
jgi:hypothetical protein